MDHHFKAKPLRISQSSYASSTCVWHHTGLKLTGVPKSFGRVCKTVQVENPPWKQELFKFFCNNHMTLHSTTGVSSATLLNGYPLKTKLVEQSPPIDDGEVRSRDRFAKEKAKFYAEQGRIIQTPYFRQGVLVLMKYATNPGKLQPKFHEEHYQVVEHKGTFLCCSLAIQNTQC